MSKNDLSIVLTAHNEGVLAHKTMLSVFEAIDELKKNNYSYEILIHIDDGDNKTVEYFNRYKKNKRIRIFTNCFRDIGVSRNYAINNSDGRYVVVLDVDDLVSKNYFIKAIKLLEKRKDDVIVHPEATLSFGRDQDCVLWMKKDSLGEKRDINILCGLNRWGSSCMAKREVFLRCPYPSTCDGYGNEDWWFNCESESMGFRHIVCKGSVRFYRLKNNGESLLQKANNAHWIQRYTHLFEINNNGEEDVLNMDEDNRIEKRGLLHRVLKKVMKIFVKDVEKPVGPEVKEIPEYVLKAWKEISKIELQLCPTEDKIRRVMWYSTELGDAVGISYFKAMEKVKTKPDYVFIVPWLRSGGADKVLLNYIKALTALHPDWSFGVLTTKPVENTWESKLPENAYLIDFGNNSKYLNDDEAELLFSRIITQLGCERLHLINSYYGYVWISNHKELVRRNYKLNVSIFGFEYVKGTNNEVIFDYMDPFMIEIYECIDRIFSDNKSIIKRGEERCGFDKEKFKVEYQPVLGDLKKPFSKQNRMIRILWASRLSCTKCPEVLCEIAKKTKSNIHIDVYGSMDNYDERIFDGIECISYCGEYSDFSKLPSEKYDFYLYTSSTDGMPNCLLEATMAGLPVIAPNVGGVGEFIKDGETGLLVKKFDDVNEYLEKINYAINNPDKMVELAESAQRLLKRRHSWESFIKNVKNDFNV